MSGSGSDPFPPGLPGEDDDLQSELDAWDRTFDALHTTDEAARQATGELGPAGARGARPAPPIAPPTATASTPSTASPPATAPPSGPLLVPGGVDLDAFADEEPTRAMHVPRAMIDALPMPGAQASSARAALELGDAGGLTLDASDAIVSADALDALAAIDLAATTELPHPAPSLPLPPLAADLDETDFSDLGFDGTPAALAALAAAPPASAPVARRPGPSTNPPSAGAPPAPRTGFEEDEIFTSAVRPASGGTNPDATRVAPAAMYLFESDQTQERLTGGKPERAPAAPAASVDRASVRTERVVRPGPAIVRRDRPTPPQSDMGFDGGEATRVGDLSAIERLARSLDEIDLLSVPADPAARDDDDDFPQIEVSDRDAAPADEPAAAAPTSVAGLAAGRRLAHVVRRGQSGAIVVPPTPVVVSRPVMVDVVDGAPVASPTDVASEVHDVIDELFGSETLTPNASPATVAVVAPFDDRTDVVPHALAAAAVADAPAAGPPPAAADPFGDDASTRTKIGVAPVPRAPTPTTPPIAASPAPTVPTVVPLFESAPHVELALDEPEPLPPQPEAPPAHGVAAFELAPFDADAELEPIVPAVVPEPPPVEAAPPTPVAPPAPRSRRATLDPSPELPAGRFGDALPVLDLDKVALPEQADLATGADPTEEAARALLVIERELERIDEPLQVAALRVEAGRQYERLGDAERARTSYEAALLADPRAGAALRGLRRLARGAGDLSEATRLLEVELQIAGPLERRALGLHRVDLLMAAGEQDLARVSVGELIDQAQGDVRAQLAQLELAFLDGRAAELDEALVRLAAALTDPALRAATQIARGHLAERGADGDRARAAFEAASQADPGAIAAWLGGLRVTAPTGWTPLVAEVERQHGDRTVTAAIGLRAAAGGLAGGLTAAVAAAPDDPLVVAELVDDAIARGQLEPGVIDAAERAADVALRRRAALWAAGRLTAAEAIDAAADAGVIDAGAAPAAPAAEDRAARAALIDRLYRAAQAAMADDAVASAARVERALIAGTPAVAAEELAARVAAGQAGELERSWAATLFIIAGRHDDAAALVPTDVDTAAPSPAATDVWAQVLGVARGAAARAALYQAQAARAADGDDRLDPRLAAAQAAAAADQAAATGQPDALRAAIAGWARVEELGGDGERAQARALALATSLGDRAIDDEVAIRAQAAAPSPAIAGTFALRRARARAEAGGDPADQAELLAEVAADDPRRHATALALAVRRGDWTEVARLHEQRADAVVARQPLEAALARYRAASLYLDRADDPARAVALLGQIIDDHPDLAFAHDLLAGARRRLGDGAPPPRTVRGELAARGADGHARLIRDASELAGQGDAVAAMALLTKALEQRPRDPLAAEPLTRVARSVREPGPLTALALAELRAAEELGDSGAVADAYEALAAIDLELRADPSSALISLEGAASADPRRLPVLRALERAHAAAGRIAELAQIRGRQLDAIDGAGGVGDHDGAALAIDRAALLEQLERPDDELRAAYQAAAVRAPHTRRPLFHLEALVRAGGPSPALLALEDAAAAYFAADPRSRAAFLTRAGGTLVELGQIDEAIARYRAADALHPGLRATLDGWRIAALRGQRWEDVATAAIRAAGATEDAAAQAGFWHLAGVVLMDHVHAGERAVDAFRQTLAIAPRHLDAFLRLRLLYDEHGEHEALAELLERRLDVEDDAADALALHRAIAELARNFLEDRERAKIHYRALVEAVPGDVHAVAALSDIAWEQGDWPTAAQTLRRRAELETDGTVLHHIHFRIGMIYAERLPDPAEAIVWFQRVLAHDPDDEAALERLADLAIATRSWKLALSACERLIKRETVPARKVAHLHRVGRIFTETNQRQRAERAYQLAVDAAPDSDTALGALIRFYEDAGDTASIRVHLGLVAASMRTRIAAHPEGESFRVLARIARARHQAGVAGQGAVARAAADIARLLGVEPEFQPEPRSIQLGALIRPEADELLWPPAVMPELRQIFALLGDRLAKHVGVDLRPYGVTRGDRLRPRENPVGAAAQDIATAFGLGEIDVYISTRQPWAMVAEPTSPPSLILGSAVADRNRLDAVRFAAAGALKHVAAQTAIPARLGEDELGVLLIALLRLFQPDLPYLAVDADQVIVQLQRLRRLIPSSLVNELRPYAMAIAPSSLDHRALARGLAAVSHRVGLIAAGGAVTPLQILLARAGAPDLGSGLAIPAVAELVSFAISEDHGALAAVAAT